MEATIFEQLFKLTGKQVKNFRSDFEIDRKEIGKHPRQKFIHITREYGTALIMMNKDLTPYPEAGEKIPYLFGTATREEILKGNKITLDYYLKANPLSIYYFDGNKLQSIKKEAAAEILDQYIQEVLTKWQTIKN